LLGIAVNLTECWWPDIFALDILQHLQRLQTWRKLVRHSLVCQHLASTLSPLTCHDCTMTTLVYIRTHISATTITAEQTTKKLWGTGPRQPGLLVGMCRMLGKDI